MLHTNIIHRIDAEQDCLEALSFQLECAEHLSIPTSNLLSLPALSEPSSIEIAEGIAERDGHELGLHFHGYHCKEVEDRFNTRETAFWLLPQPTRARIIDLMMQRFQDRFGHLPKSVGCYILDAWTLKYLKSNYAEVECAISNCFEEGVKMFHGNNNNWNLFSDGGPWGPFYPSRDCALVPAANAEEAIDVVSLPHLSRDMIYALISRDDYFATHPGNVFRARINEGDCCPYLFRHIDAWLRQSQFNPTSYINIFVSSPWLLQRHWTVDSQEDVRSLYRKTLQHVAENPAIKACTMADFSKTFREKTPHGKASICHWKDELSGSKREIAWIVNPHFRAAIDMNAGGSICDLRSYSGKLNLDMGPETKAKWNGSYPFLVSAELRGGHQNSHQGFELTYKGTTVSCLERRGRCKILGTHGDNGWNIKLEPLTYLLGDLKVSLQSEWKVGNGGEIRVTRSLVGLSDSTAAVGIAEVLSGTFGTTEYPEDLDGVSLALDQEGSPHYKEVRFSLSGKPATCGKATSVSVVIPQAKTTLSLSSNGELRDASIQDGTLTHPNYRMSIGREIKLNQTMKTYLTIAPQT
ncbi:hypothetical protein QEH56_14755 [Pelagicoccus enzymogenes]|uniref:hypothetical protein n=1 Tax=Pelagicoccus enzymogenes TaxID=2773457 RepID=UPI00280D5ED5|nr:hypothetical protein [Pelagicoccus enzymogenes]MDQ8199424.1 hypothetical protein [Pelagicoccus enzymogenes]